MARNGAATVSSAKCVAGKLCAVQCELGETLDSMDKGDSSARLNARGMTTTVELDCPQPRVSTKPSGVTFPVGGGVACTPEDSDPCPES